MPKTHEGVLRSAGRRFAIVASRFNDSIGDRLVEGALDAVRRTGGSADDVDLFRCPGALEIPGLTRLVVASGRFDGVICIGVVIRGATPHFDLVVNQAVAGIARIAAGADIPVTCGVLACETTEQAMERAGTKAGNRGTDAAMAAIEMADLYASLQSGEGVGKRVGKRVGNGVNAGRAPKVDRASLRASKSNGAPKADGGPRRR